MFKKGYQPINEVTPTTLPPTSTSWFVGLTGGVVVAILMSAALAIVFGVLHANLQNQLNTANANLDTLEMFTMELAEASGMNTTYEELVTGRCEIEKGCAGDIYSGAFRVLLAHTGPFTAVVAEVSPFDTLEAKKKKKRDSIPSRSITGRAPGQILSFNCVQNPPSTINFRLLLKSTASQLGISLLTPGQLANFNLTGPNIGNGAGQTKYEVGYQTQNIFFYANFDVYFELAWYPDFVPCAGDVFDLTAPTKFTLGPVLSTIGSSKKKREIVSGPAQREHKIHTGPDTAGRKAGH